MNAFTLKKTIGIKIPVFSAQFFICSLLFYLLLSATNVAFGSSSKGDTSLLIHVIDQKLDSARFDLEHGANPNYEPLEGFSAFVVACTYGNTAMIELLMTHGADADPTKNTGMGFAIIYGNLDALKFLRSKHVPYTGSAKYPLHLCAAATDKALFNYTLQMIKAALTAPGATLPPGGLNGIPEPSPVFYEPVAEYILSDGNDIMAVNDEGKTPFDVALNEKRLPAINFFLSNNGLLAGDKRAAGLLSLEIDSNRLDDYKMIVTKYVQPNDNLTALLPKILIKGEQAYYQSLSDKHVSFQFENPGSTSSDRYVLNTLFECERDSVRIHQRSILNKGHFALLSKIFSDGYKIHRYDDYEDPKSPLATLCESSGTSAFRDSIAVLLTRNGNGDSISVNNAFITACANNSGLINKLIAPPCDVNYQSNRCLHEALAANNENAVKLIFDQSSLSIADLEGFLLEVSQSWAAKYFLRYVLKEQVIKPDVPNYSYSDYLHLVDRNKQLLLSNIDIFRGIIYLDINRRGTIITTLIRPDYVNYPVPESSNLYKWFRLSSYQNIYNYTVSNRMSAAAINVTQNDLIFRIGDQMYYHDLTGSFTVPKIAFDINNQLLYTGVTINNEVYSDVKTPLKVTQNGDIFMIAPHNNLTLDRSNGDILVNIGAGQKGPPIDNNVDVTVSVNPLGEIQIPSGLSDNDRLKLYLKLYIYKAKYNKPDNSLNFKSYITLLNHTSLKARFEKYDEYAKQQVSQLAGTILGYDKNIIALRNFYFSYNELTIEQLPQLKQIILRVLVNLDESSPLYPILTALQKKISETTDVSAISVNYLQIFSDQFFKQVQDLLAKFQISVLELAQYITDDQLSQYLALTDANRQKLKQTYNDKEIFIKDNTLNGRGSRIKSILGL